MRPIEIAWNFLKADFSDPSVREVMGQIGAYRQQNPYETTAFLTPEEIQEKEAAAVERALADEDVRQSIPPENYKGGFSELDMIFREQGEAAALEWLAQRGIAGEQAMMMLYPDY